MIELGPARVVEAPMLAQMSRTLVESGLTWRWQAAPIAALIRDPTVEVVVARDGAEIVGFGAMKLDRDVGHLLLLAVRPDDRRVGIGRQLMIYLTELAHTALLDRILLEVRANNLGAQRFYQSMGYKQVQLVRGYYEGRETAVRMSFDLTAS